MIEVILGTLVNFVSNLIAAAGYPGIFVFMAMESAFIPIPSEIVMPFAGSLAAGGQLNLTYSIAAGTLGNLFGASIAYMIGSKIGEEPIRKFAKNHGKFFLITEKRINMAIKLFEKYGLFSVAIGRLVPGARAFISLPAGMAGLSYIKFLALTFMGSFLWISLLSVSGYILGENWETISPVLHKFNFILVILIFTVAIFYIRYLTRVNRNKQKTI